ncbi:hypothetical protein CPARA_1gp007 (nucleomorph) [Cryptomonas paramecium]|uniref:Uncharacterized protein n=1 Tax=Cryptomonas paramaecium TaxID=2898 RepID=F2HH69_9CRYP|nr:hypothetical protein CPARA_1gp007 [Cryptomonas paramecium]AEA38665.1 hypothetical protein CPARA_1gp007 [Cryptomonas paramecium]|mmetsp:Transcript_52765/g.138817  ORF Transcript_52765/g.138817 Transcript_52765/m.138817 type:complete len:379 (+) Transcript_52765:170-1306(+)
MEQLFNALISLCLCKKLKLGYLIWKVQKNNKKNQVLFTLKKIFKKEIKYKIRKKLMFKKYIIVKNFKQDHIDNRHQIYSFFCLKIFMNKFLNKIFREIGQISNIIQQSYSKQKKLKNVLLFLKKINLIEKTKIDHKNIKKFNSKSFDAIYIQKSNMPAKFIGNENYKNNANIKCISNYALNLFKFLFQKTNQLKKKNISPNFKKTTQLKILKFKLLYLFIFMFKTKKFYSTLIRKVVEYDIILTISMFLRKKNLSNNKLHVKYAKKKINFQMHKFFFSKKNLCIFYRTKISIPCKFCLIYTKKRYFFNVVVIEIFLKNLFRSYKLRSKIIPEYLKDFFQLKFNHIFVLKDPSYRKIKKTFVNKIFRSNLKFKAYFQSN